MSVREVGKTEEQNRREQKRARAKRMHAARIRAKRRHLRKMKRCLKGSAAVICCCVIVFCAGQYNSDFRNRNLFQSLSSLEESAGTQAEDVRLPGNQRGDAKYVATVGILKSAVDLSELYSPKVVLVDLASGERIAKKEVNQKIYPASLTKIMTAILAIEHTEDFSEPIRIPDGIKKDLDAQEASVAGFKEGEEASREDLLYGVLLPSGAECCIAFAEEIAGSEEAFVEMMNAKADKLGMKHTRFENCTGLHDRLHYSTVEDMAVLLEYALENERFRTVFTESWYPVRSTRQHPFGFSLESTMAKYAETSEVSGGQILGGKTGYTEEAGLCLASLAQVDGKEYIMVTAGAKGSYQTKPFHVLDAVNVYSQIAAIQP